VQTLRRRASAGRRLELRHRRPPGSVGGRARPSSRRHGPENGIRGGGGSVPELATPAAARREAPAHASALVVAAKGHEHAPPVMTSKGTALLFAGEYSWTWTTPSPQGGGRRARALGHVLFPCAGGGVDALVP
jgi:hypothetical protein